MENYYFQDEVTPDGIICTDYCQTATCGGVGGDGLYRIKKTVCRDTATDESFTKLTCGC